MQYFSFTNTVLGVFIIIHSIASGQKGDDINPFSTPKNEITIETTTRSDNPQQKVKMHMI